MSREISKIVLLKSVKLIFVFALIFLLIIHSRVVSAASDASFSIVVPNGGSLVQGCFYNANIILNTGTNQVNGADLFIDYDPSRIEIQDTNTSIPGKQISPGSVFSSYPIQSNQVNESLGTIRLAGVNYSNPFSGEGLFATIRFRSINNTSNGFLNFRFSGVGNTLDSNIAEYTTSQDVLGAVTNANMTFSSGGCIGDNQLPDVNFISPVNNQSNVPLNQNISLNVSDNSGIDIQTLKVIVNGVVYTSLNSEMSITGSPLSYNIILDPNQNFYPNSPSNIYVFVSDFAGNSRESTISFNYQAIPTLPPTVTQTPTTSPISTFTPTIAPTLPPSFGNGPLIVFVKPIQGGNIEENTIQVQLKDSDGVDLNTLAIYVNQTRYLITDQAVTYSGTSNDFLITLKTSFSFNPSFPVFLNVYVSDLKGNPSANSILVNIPQNLVTPTKEYVAPIVTNIPGAGIIANVQKTLEESSPELVKPIIEQNTVYGLASLVSATSLFFWLLSILFSLILGGFFWPLLKLFVIPQSKKKGQILDSFSKSGISFVRITYKNRDSEKIGKSITDFNGKYSISLERGNYLISISHKDYVEKDIEVSMDSSGYLDRTIILEKELKSDLGSIAQFRVFSINFKLIVVLVSLMLALLNLVYIQTFFSIMLFIILLIVLIIIGYMNFSGKKPSL